MNASFDLMINGKTEAEFCIIKSALFALRFMLFLYYQSLTLSSDFCKTLYFEQEILSDTVLSSLYLCVNVHSCSSILCI